MTRAADGLSAEERAEIEAEARRYPERRSAGLDALRIVQQHRGWVSDEALCAVADHLAMSADELEGLATFYNLIHRHPVGRHVILVCDSVSCWLCGYRELHAGLQRRLGVDFGGTTADGRFTLLPNPCLGRCERAPVLQIDGEAHERVEAGAIGAILERYQ